MEVIDEMCDRDNTKHEGPNVVARLMGMDTFPKKTGATIHSKECFDENLRQHARSMLVCESAKVDLCSLPSNAKKSSLNFKHQYLIPSSKRLSSKKPHRREHPQEDQLQIFKKEFEAWQEFKLGEFSSNPNRYSSEDLKKEQIFALENPNKEEMSAYKKACSIQKNPLETDGYAPVNNLKITQNNLQGLQHNGSFGKQLMNKVEDESRELEDNSLEPASSGKLQEKRNPPSSPTRIVILKPSSDVSDEVEEPWGGSPEVAEKCSSMEDFLEEVKERLRLEMEGKVRNDSTRRLSVDRTSVHEISTNPKQMALEAAKLGAILRRSQSMITYRNQFHFDGQESSKSIKREARKFISERLKYVLRDDTEMKKPVLDDGSAGKSLSVKEMARSTSFTAFSKGGKEATFWEDKKAEIESIPKHLRHEQMEMVPLDVELMSSSNSVGSFSASTSGSAFGRARLEDRGAETKAHNSQKFEASKNDSAIVQMRKKDGFSIKSTVSNLRRNLGLRGKLFRKKATSMGESTVNTVHYVNQDETVPSVTRNFSIVQDNSTEVPPSPASFPSSPVNDHHSPVSPLEDPFMDDHSSTQVSGELSMILTEFENQTEHVEIKSCEMETQTQPYDGDETTLTEGGGEAFVRDILVVSGFYRASWPLDEVKPISSCVFDEVEAKCRNLRRNVDDVCPTVSVGDVDIDRKMLFDLVNESLPSVIDAPMTRLMPGRSTHHLTQFPRGSKLLDDLLNQIHVHVDPKVGRSHSIDEMVVWDLKLVPWAAASHEDICALCREVEWVIISDLVDDLLSDLLV